MKRLRYNPRKGWFWGFSFWDGGPNTGFLRSVWVGPYQDGKEAFHSARHLLLDAGDTP